jgi:diacylglycerol kinase family enzyme
MSDRLRTLVIYALRGRYDVEAVDTQAPGHAIELTREAADEGYDVIVTLGGDGTVNEAANGLAGSSTPMTPLPGGATNVLCKMLGLSGDIVDATANLLRMADDWQPRTIDLARVNGRHFTFSAGLGIDAAVVKRVDSRPDRKSALRHWYFLYTAIQAFSTDFVRHPPDLEVTAGGRVIRGVSLVVQNGREFTYFRDRPVLVAPGGDLGSGRLVGAMLDRAAVRDVPSATARLFSASPITGHPHVHGIPPTSDMVCRSLDGRPISLEVDGDWIGDVSEAVFGVSPGALTVLA